MAWKRKILRRKAPASKKSMKVSKPLRKAVKQIINKNVETKTINVPTTPGGGTNSVNVPYTALSGLLFLAQDVFRVPQGVEDSTALGAPNRLGDKITGVGFLMDYYFTTVNNYPAAATSFFLPYVKLRITVFRQAFGVPTLTAPLLYDNSFLATNTSTLQPINWGEGYVKDVLYDRVHIIRNQISTQVPGGGGGTPNISPVGNVFHFRKYMKYPHVIKYADNNAASPESTEKPIYIAISAEVDDANTGIVPSGTKIMFVTGYTRAWFKDA